MNINEYMQISRETGAYMDIELDILEETLRIWKEKPGVNFELIELRDGSILAGFCLYNKIPHTDFSFDIISFIVGRDYKNKAVGTRLLELLEENLNKNLHYTIIRVETSYIKEHALGDNFFLDSGFQMLGHIPSFYDKDNDYFIYIKAVFPPKNEAMPDNMEKDSEPGPDEADGRPAEADGMNPEWS